MNFSAFSPPYAPDGVQVRLTRSSMPMTASGAAKPSGMRRARPAAQRAQQTPTSSRPSRSVTSAGTAFTIACSLKSPMYK